MVFWLLVLLNQGFLCGSTINQCPEGRISVPHWGEMKRWHFINDLRLQQIRPPFILHLYCCYFLNLPRSMLLGELLPQWHSCQDVPQSEQVFSCCGLIWTIKINIFGRVPEIWYPAAAHICTKCAGRPCLQRRVNSVVLAYWPQVAFSFYLSFTNLYDGYKTLYHLLPLSLIFLTYLPLLSSTISLQSQWAPGCF